MIKDVLRPKSKEEVMESLRNLKIPSYRLSSFLKLVDVADATKYRKWCVTVFHTDPKDMEVSQFHDTSPWHGPMKLALGIGGTGFASNANLRIMKLKHNYYAYPRGEIGNILTKFYIYERIHT